MANEDDIGFKIYALIDGLKESMQQSSAAVKTFATSAKEDIEKIGAGFNALKAVTEAYLAVLGVEKIEAFFEKFAQEATQINRLGLEFGITADQVQGLQFAMAATGGSGDQLQSLLSRLSVGLEKAIDNAGPQRQAFENLGISLKFLQDNANNVPGVLNALADAVQKAGAGSQVTAELIPLMGRGAASVVPALAQGSAGLRALAQAAQDTGGVMDELEKGQFESLHRSLTTMQESFNGFGITIASAFAPAFQAIIDGITEMVSALNGGSEHVSIFRDLLVGLVAPIDAVVLAIESIKVAMVEAWQTITIATDGIYFSFKALGQYIKDVAKGDFKQAETDWNNTMAEMDRTTSEHVAAMKKEIDDLGATVSRMGQGIAGLISGNSEQYGPEYRPVKKKDSTEDQKNAAAAAANELAIEKDKISTELELSKLGLEGKKKDLDAEVDAGKITQQQKYEALQDYAALEYQANMDALDKEAALYDEDSKEYQAVLNKKAILTAQYQNQISAINKDAAKAQEQEYKQLTDTIDNSLDQMLTGVLQGTQTWRQAMTKIADDLAISFIESQAKIAANWAITESLKTAATLSGNTTRTASDNAASGGSFLSMIGAKLARWVGVETGMTAATVSGNAARASSTVASEAAEKAATTAANIATLTGDSALVFGGVFANLSPVLGPAAAGPAEAAQAAVLAQLPLVSAAGGFDIPAGVNPVTQLHQREMVLPAYLADTVRNMAAGGGGGGNSGVNVTIQLSAIDTQTGMQFIHSQAENIADAINQQIRNGNPALTPSSLATGRH